MFVAIFHNVKLLEHDLERGCVSGCARPEEKPSIAVGHLSSMTWLEIFGTFCRDTIPYEAL